MVPAASPMTTWAVCTFIKAIIGVVVVMVVVAVRAMSVMVVRADLRRMRLKLVVDDDLRWTAGVYYGGRAVYTSYTSSIRRYEMAVGVLKVHWLMAVHVFRSEPASITTWAHIMTIENDRVLAPSWPVHCCCRRAGFALKCLDTVR